MNLILFEEHECRENRLLLTGKRADHIHSILRLATGDTLRIGMVNGRIGQGRILSMESGSVELAVQLERDPLPVPPVELILALPRPIMLQRILKQATVLGVRHFHLIRSARVEKSFFHSPVLQPEKIRALLLEGLTQAVDTRLPEVTVHHRFKPFVQDEVPKLDGQGLIAHPGIADTLLQVFSEQVNNQTILLAIGPEGGWNDFELRCFYEQGFYGFSMGSRILHVDTAVVALLAQLQLLDNAAAQGADFCSRADRSR
jgi:RsmE family RNA methyltransferase